MQGHVNGTPGFPQDRADLGGIETRQVQGHGVMLVGRQARQERDERSQLALSDGLVLK